MDSLISQFYNDYKTVKFEYGKTDCMLFINDWLTRNGKTNYRNIYSDSYGNKREAIAVLKKHECNTPSELIDKLFDRVSHRRAKRGSLCSTDTKEGPAMGVYDGENGLFLLLNGVAVIPKSKIYCFWSIN